MSLREDAENTVIYVGVAGVLGVRWSGLLDRDVAAPQAPRSYRDEDGL